MGARPIGSGSISFGLVSIPVKLYPATRPGAGVSFNLLHAACGSRIRQQYVCHTCKETVDRSQLVRGYEFAKDRYVTFAEQELKEIEAHASQTIEIEEFVELGAVDPLFFDRAYYLGPDSGGEKAYRLLAEVMTAAGRVALAKHVLQGKEHLVLVRPYAEGLILHTMYFADEIRDVTEVDRGNTVTLRDAEQSLARKLIDELATAGFQPSKYHDEYRARLLELVEAKVAGREVTAPPAEARRAEVIDLMEALKESLARRAAPGTATGRHPARAKHPAAPTRTRKSSKK